VGFASAVFLGYDFCDTQDQILLPQIRDSPKLEGQVPVSISPWNRVAQLYPQTLRFLVCNICGMFKRNRFRIWQETLCDSIMKTN
jgi:hypothetical protein